MAQLPKGQIVGAECRHVMYLPPAPGSDDDYHLVKEVLHIKQEDGNITKVPNLRRIRNFKRKFGVTKEGYRKYTQKKEWEDAKKLQIFECTQAQLLERASRALGMMKPARSMRQLARNPYLFGTDIDSRALVKQEIYRQHFPNLFTPSTVAATDTETSMVDDKVIMQTISFKDRVYTAVVRRFLSQVGGDDNYKKNLLREAMTKYLGDVVEKRGIQWEIDIVEDEGVVVWNVLQKAHSWKPDILTFWNMPFDVKKMNQSLEAFQIDIANAWSDPSVPERFKSFDFKEGQPQKVTASGKVTPIPPQARWHTVTTPASFYLLDSMCCYKQVRTGKQEERSYALDFILEKHLKRGKLKFTQADGLSKADWHVFMQKRFPIEYVIYNVFDCVGLEMLDEKTKDLSVSVPSGAAMTDYSRFNSQPRRVCDKLHYFVKARGRMMGTTSDEMASEFDRKTISLASWINNVVMKQLRPQSPTPVMV